MNQEDLAGQKLTIVRSGETTKAIMNLRYTDSMLSALNDVPMLGKKLEQIGSTTVPSMKLTKLRFTCVTEY